MREKMSKEERAKQFMPFAALRGYDSLVKSSDKVVCEKKELSEEEQAALSQTVLKLKKGDIVRVKFYNIDGYCEIKGAVTGIDLVFKSVTVIKEKINFADISELEICEDE